MFMGVGILKVKSLFRKLRRLALRYGGVIVFFDEADSLGNRGMMTQGAPGGQQRSADPAFAHAGCHGSRTCRRTPSGGWPGMRWNRRSPTSQTPGAAAR